MMANIADLIPSVAPDVHGCPDAIIEQAIRNSAIEFCRASAWWRVDHEPITVVPNIADYEMTAPVGAVVVAPIHVAVEGDEIRSVDAGWLNTNISGWRDTKGSITCYMVPTHGTIRLVHVPDRLIISGLTLRMILMPAQSATTIDDAIFNHYHEAIAHGAKARLKAMPSKPWSAQGDVVYHKSEYERGIGGAKSEAIKGNAGASLTVRPRPFY